MNTVSPNSVRPKLACRWRHDWAVLVSLLMLTACGTANPTVTLTNIRIVPVALPGGSAGIGFDDLGYSPDLGRVLVPAGRTGNLDLIDPKSLAVTTIAGFSSEAAYGGGHVEGTTSADVAEGRLIAIDRTRRVLVVIDPSTKQIVGSANLASGPDYVRYVTSTHEVWVTEPDAEQIEILSLTGQAPAHAGTISIKGGPESLVIDPSGLRAYTHLWNDQTVAVDLNSRSVSAPWSNGCSTGSRGIALDTSRGFLFTGCAEGKVTALDVKSGKLLSTQSIDSGVDVIAYNPQLAHLYAPSASSGALAVVGVSTQGQLSLLGTASTARGAHCVTVDNLGQAWVCDPDHGQLLMVQDSFSSPPR